MKTDPDLSSTVDEVFTLDGSAVGLYSRDVALLHLHTINTGVLEHLHSWHMKHSVRWASEHWSVCAVGRTVSRGGHSQRSSDLRRGHHAVSGQMQRSHQVMHVHQRVQACHVSGLDEVTADAQNPADTQQLVKIRALGSETEQFWIICDPGAQNQS